MENNKQNKSSAFWKAVDELAKMRDKIPKVRRNIGITEHHHDSMCALLIDPMRGECDCYDTEET